MKEASQKVKNLQDAYFAAKRAGFTAEARELGRQLGVLKAEITLQNEHYKAMLQVTTEKLAHANEIALNYINDNMAGIYAINFNAFRDEAMKYGLNFALVDEHTVKNLALNDKSLLPHKELNIPKDMRWNTKQINSAVMQGILQGEPINKIADRLYPIMNNNMTSAIRNARTMVTSAENKGRFDRMAEMTEDDGIVMEKVWMATHDDRTRESHALMDGEAVKPDEEFSNGLMYPADPSGAPEEVYNCRCTTGAHVIGFRRKDGSIEYVEGYENYGYQPDYDFKQLENINTTERHTQVENVEKNTAVEESSTQPEPQKDIPLINQMYDGTKIDPKKSRRCHWLLVRW